MLLGGGGRFRGWRYARIQRATHNDSFLQFNDQTKTGGRLLFCLRHGSGTLRQWQRAGWYESGHGTEYWRSGVILITERTNKQSEFSRSNKSIDSKNFTRSKWQSLSTKAEVCLSTTFRLASLALIKWNCTRKSPTIPLHRAKTKGGAGDGHYWPLVKCLWSNGNRGYFPIHIHEVHMFPWYLPQRVLCWKKKNIFPVLHSLMYSDSIIMTHTHARARTHTHKHTHTHTHTHTHGVRQKSIQPVRDRFPVRILAGCLVIFFFFIQ